MNLLEKVKKLAEENYWNITEYILRSQETNKEYKRLILSKKIYNGEYRHIEINFETPNKIDRLWYRVRDLLIMIHDLGVFVYLDQIDFPYSILSITSVKIDLNNIIINMLIEHSPEIRIINSVLIVS